MICGDCKFWLGDAAAAQAVCRRYPPQAAGVVMQNGFQGPQPVIVWANPEPPRAFWCGEWAERAPTADQVN